MDEDEPRSVRAPALKKVKLEPQSPVESLSKGERFTLIDLIHDHSVLWDETSEGYKGSYGKAMAWKAVQQEMEGQFGRSFERELELGKLQSTFKNLRDLFIKKKRELRMHLARSSGASAADSIQRRMGKWPFWKALQFLPPSVSTGLRFSNVVPSSSRKQPDVVLLEDSEESVSQPLSALASSTERQKRKPKSDSQRKSYRRANERSQGSGKGTGSLRCCF